MVDYNSGGFVEDGNGVIFGNPDGTSNGSVADYDTWDWKQIKAAICGMASGPVTPENMTHARDVANPQSLQDAAVIFHHVQRVLEGVAKSLVDQTAALAGDDGPWKGGAADSFVVMTTNFSNQVKANAAVLSGGSTGYDSVPQQLADNAAALQSAQNKIVEIESWYVQQAINMGVSSSGTTVSVSQAQGVVPMMNQDMRSVLKSLASAYQVTVDKIITPVPVKPPTSGGGDPGGGNPSGIDPGGVDPSGIDPGGVDPSGLDLGGGDPGSGGLAGMPGGPDPQSLAGLSAMPDTGIDTGVGAGGGIGDLGGGPGPLGGAAAFPRRPGRHRRERIRRYGLRWRR